MKMMFDKRLNLRGYAALISDCLQKNPKFQWRFTRLVYAFKGIYLRRCETPPQEKDGRFVFIVGCGRSGNTLLRRLLMERYSIYIPPETYVLTNQIIRYNKIPNKCWCEKVDAVLGALEYHPEFMTFGVGSLAAFSQEAKAWHSNKRTLFSLIDGLYRWIGQESGWVSEWVGDKTPLNTLNLGIIQEVFPNAKFIYLERDPVDVVSSYLKSGIYRDAGKAAERWVKSTVAWKNFKSLHGEDKCFEVKYETLVTQPAATLDKIGLIFNIPQSLSNDIEPGLSMGDVEVHTHHANSMNPPSETSIGKGRSKVPEPVLRTIRPIIGSHARNRGYDEV